MAPGLTCKMQRAPGENTIALIGDSHANHLYPGMMALAKENEGIAVFPASCAIPLIGLHSGADPDTVKRNRYRGYTEHLLSEGFSYVISHKEIKKVLLYHAPGCSYNNVVDKQNPNNSDFNSILHDGFARTYDALTKAGKEIYIVLDSPNYKNEIWAKCQASVSNRPSYVPDFGNSDKRAVCTVKSSNRKDRVTLGNWNKVSHEAAVGYKNVHFINLGEVFCPGGICSMLDGKGKLLYRDGGHLNIKGSIYAAPYVFKKLRE